MTRQEIRSVQKNDSPSSAERSAPRAQSGQGQTAAAPESLEEAPESLEENANADADDTSRVPLPSYGTLFHEGATFGQSRGSWISEESSTGGGSPSGAKPEPPQQDSERG